MILPKAQFSRGPREILVAIGQEQKRKVGTHLVSDNEQTHKVLFGVCGSISAYKAPWIVRELIRLGASVRVVMTPSAAQFVSPLVLQNLSRHPVAVESFAENQQQDGSWHVHWARWCDLALVAPCSASTLARLQSGLADNALALCLLSLPAATPLKLAPAMDPDMWLHPSTRRNVAVLRDSGVDILEPATGELASGLEGPGRLPEPVELANWALRSGSWRGRKVLVTAGPTREPIDAVRFLSNHSTGKMGYALAAEAHRRGARVVLVSGPVALPAPPGVERIAVESAADMLQACVSHHADSDVIFKAAAVADFTPATVAAGKLKKEQLGAEWALAMSRTQDILGWLGQHKPAGQFLVGFALETDNPEENARRKLEAKHCDMVVLNRAGQPNSGFGGDRNTVTLVEPVGSIALPTASKTECARAILDAVEARLRP